MTSMPYRSLALVEPRGLAFTAVSYTHLRAHETHVLAVAAPTTGDAASTVAGIGDPTVVAIASDRAAVLNGLTILDDNVGDHPEAFTRFVSVAPYTRLDRREGDWRTAFSFMTDHRPGALFHALEPLSRHGVDLNLLVSRPIPSRPFSYRFDAVLSGHPLDHGIAATLREMHALTAELRVFGSYRSDREGGFGARSV